MSLPFQTHPFKAVPSVDVSASWPTNTKTKQKRAARRRRFFFDRRLLGVLILRPRRKRGSVLPIHLNSGFDPVDAHGSFGSAYDGDNAYCS